MLNEITPVSAEQSLTGNYDEETKGAHLAIDLDYDTSTWTVGDAYGNIWLRVELDQVHA